MINKITKIILDSFSCVMNIDNDVIPVINSEIFLGNKLLQMKILYVKNIDFS